MRNKFAALAVAVLTAGAFASAAMADGPKLSSGTNIPSVQTGYPVSQYDAAMLGPKVSSGTRIAQAPYAPAAAAGPPATVPGYVWQEGYDPHGKWRGHWVSTR